MISLHSKRQVSRSLYFPTPKIMFSRIALRAVTGVFSSWEAARRKSIFDCSASLAFRFSSSRFSMVESRLAYSLLTRAANSPISSLVCTTQTADLSSFSIFSVISAICLIGLVMALENNREHPAEMMAQQRRDTGSAFPIADFIRIPVFTALSIMAPSTKRLVLTVICGAST